MSSLFAKINQRLDGFHERIDKEPTAFRRLFDSFSILYEPHGYESLPMIGQFENPGYKFKKLL